MTTMPPDFGFRAREPAGPRFRARSKMGDEGPVGDPRTRDPAGHPPRDPPLGTSPDPDRTGLPVEPGHPPRRDPHRCGLPSGMMPAAWTAGSLARGFAATSALPRTGRPGPRFIRRWTDDRRRDPEASDSGGHARMRGRGAFSERWSPQGPTPRGQGRGLPAARLPVRIRRASPAPNRPLIPRRPSPARGSPGPGS